LREVYFLVIFFLLDGITSPGFLDFQYVYLQNVLGIRKFQYALLTLEQQVFSVVGVIVYDLFLKNVEVRSINFVNTVLFTILNFFFYA
jgi:hypothetical protein